MFLRLLFLLTFIPLTEIYFLLKLSDSIGGWNTLALIFATGFLGAWLLRTQGHSILRELKTSHLSEQLPSDSLTRGFFIFIGGLLLLTPGILTDFIGLSLIVPITQALWKKYFMGLWKKGLARGQFRFYSYGKSDSGFNPFQTHRKNQTHFGEQMGPDSFSSFERKDSVIDVKAQSRTIEKEENS